MNERQIMFVYGIIILEFGILVGLSGKWWYLITSPLAFTIGVMLSRVRPII